MAGFERSVHGDEARTGIAGALDRLAATALGRMIADQTARRCAPVDAEGTAPAQSPEQDMRPLAQLVPPTVEQQLALLSAMRAANAAGFPLPPQYP